MKTKLLLTFTALCLATLAMAQTQVGVDIDGEAAWDLSGNSVSMPDAITVAIGAYLNDGSGDNAGHVRVYEWNGSAWTQKGTDIDGEALEDESGSSVSMPDANTVAIGAPHNDGSDFSAGQVRVYTWNGGTWVQKGMDIDGETTGNQFGWNVSMPDANTVAIGAPLNDGSGTNAGHVRVYSWNGSNWVQKGTDLDGEADGDFSGTSVSMPDANTVAIGAPHNDGSDFSAGQVRVYTWNGSAWTQKGMDMDGEAAFDQAGTSVNMPDANTVAIGAPYNSENGLNAGHVRVYAWNGSAWAQKGIDIDGEPEDRSGWSLSMPNTNMVAIGAIYNGSGLVRVYAWNGSDWIQTGTDIDGEAASDQSGSSVSMPDTNTLAIGAPLNNGNDTDSGHVRVYSLIPVGIDDDKTEENLITVHPNPTKDELNIALGKVHQDLTVRIVNLSGQLMAESRHTDTDKLQLRLDTPPGIYFVQISSSGKPLANVKVVKE